MEDRSLEKLESRVDRLLDAFVQLKAENTRLREELAGTEVSKALVKNRLDSIIEKLDRSFAE